MMKHLSFRHRIVLALGAAGGLCLAAALVAVGFALGAMWPGVSWAVGSALGLVVLVVTAPWLRAAITGRTRSRDDGALGKGGAI